MKFENTPYIMCLETRISGNFAIRGGGAATMANPITQLFTWKFDKSKWNAFCSRLFSTGLRVFVDITRSVQGYPQIYYFKSCYFQLFIL